MSAKALASIADVKQLKTGTSTQKEAAAIEERISELFSSQLVNTVDRADTHLFLLHFLLGGFILISSIWDSEFCQTKSFH